MTSAAAVLQHWLSVGAPLSRMVEPLQLLPLRRLALMLRQPWALEYNLPRRSSRSAARVAARRPPSTE